MPALPNPKHELFAQGLAKGLSASASYQAAGYSKNDGNAGRLNRNEQVLNRLAELQAKAEQRVMLTLEDHMARLAALSKKAEESGQTAAAITAEVKRGELMGYYVQRRESTNTNYNISDKPLSEDEFEAEYGMDAPAGASTRTH